MSLLEFAPLPSTEYIEYTVMEFSGCVNDESIGPAVEGCRGDFDFTIKFERICFLLIPTAIFITICLPRIFYLSRQPIIVYGGRILQIAKVVRPSRSFQFMRTSYF